MLSDAKTFTLLSFLVAGTTMVNAHGHVAKWTVGGEEHAGFKPSNPPEYGATAERPTDNSDQGFAAFTTAIVACGGLSAGSGLETWDVNAGDSVTAHWNTWPDSHKGPVTEYMAACPSSGCDGVDASSLQWFKIQEDTFEGSKWPSDTIVSTLDWTFTIPTDLAAGPYLVRHDILAMHTVGGPQVYPTCFQANLISSGSAVPTETTTFPAAYDINDDFKTWSIYNDDNTQFVPPGPAVYSGGSSGTPPGTSAAPSASASSSAPAESSAAATSAPAASSAAATEPATSDVASEAPSSTSAVEPVETSAAASSSAPAESAPAESSAAASATSSAPASSPTSTTPGNVEMGGGVPPVTQNGNRYETLGGSYDDEHSAVVAACMEQMNRCKNWADSLPNSEVSAALTACDTQETTCESSGASVKRAIVMNRYAKKGLRLF
ncbi:uncharacterized protein I303_106957 [Kwoniella dejecticola CBS 10117]|uniref:lytic cellulose monooxygenase (C4-dehydrogenating) n=1 Tax=Kwoniella dejecticola CBS 10117 TaxID=1296121 RepID=A0A1A5ZYB2_9TREE|nr:uncharacterized protein I303_06358 [Kwoniella dejecticola CBS 10117]OBR82801.1 hypothetical protein I303_06358 [Kwoniella dejecticola CBS 10117]